MKITKLLLMTCAVVTLIAAISCITTGGGGGSEPARSAPAPVTYRVLETKGTPLGQDTPAWITTYISGGVSRVQALPEFKDKYCVIGEETGVNKQFVLAWADSFSAQQRIGAMLRTTIASKYQAEVAGSAQSVGGANSSTAVGAGSSQYQQQINNSINSIVNVSYSGAQRENDWWMLTRRYDPDDLEIFSDEYSAYVLYTVPKSQLNAQIAEALRTSISADSELYAITLRLAQEILLDGMEYMGAGDLEPAAVPPSRPANVPASGANAGKVVIRNNSYDTSSVMSVVKIYNGFDAKGEPFMVYENPVLGGQQISWDLAEGIYCFETFLNTNTESIAAGLLSGGTRSVGITAGDSFVADFEGGRLSSFSKK